MTRTTRTICALLLACPHVLAGSTPLNVVPSKPAGFRLIPGVESGVRFTNSLPDGRSITNRILLSGAGVAAGDVNGDGRCDLYFCNLTGANALYLGQGNFRFKLAEGSGAAPLADSTSTGAVFADVDGDGDLDLLVSSMGEGVRLFLNNGSGVFTDGTAGAGLSRRAGSMSMTLADIDGDGDLDLYVANFRESTLRDQLNVRFKLRNENGRPALESVNGVPATHPAMTNRFVVTSSGAVLEVGEPDFLFINNGSGRFTAASFTDGRFKDESGRPLDEPPRDWGLAARFQDMNGDGAPDLYVCNDLFTPDRIWLNDGRGNFRAMPAKELRHTSTSSMGVDFADLDGDGRFDFFVTDMLSPLGWRRRLHGDDSMRPTPDGVRGVRPQVSRNTLFRSIGPAGYVEIAQQAGVEASEWSWGPVFLDVDFDGFEDLIVPAGQRHDFQNAVVAQALQEASNRPGFNHASMLEVLGRFPPLAAPVAAFRNKGDMTFEPVSDAWGFTNAGVFQGMAAADLDGDGDMDLIINRLNDAPAIYENTGSAPRVKVVLKGLGANTAGIGALIKTTDQSGRVRMQEMIAGGRYLSGDEACRSFAAPTHLKTEVVWRSGRVSMVEDSPPNSEIIINEASAAPRSREPVKPPRQLFVKRELPGYDTGGGDPPFDDLARQPGMPASKAGRGCGVSWLDLRGDRKVSLFAGCRRGGVLRGWVFGEDGLPSAMTNGVLQKPLSRDAGSILTANGALLAASSNYRDGATNGGWMRAVALDRNVSGEILLGPRASAGTAALGDIDGDGDLDLFVGGFCRPGSYPEPSDSLLARNDSGRFVAAWVLERVGLVTGSVMCDLDGDGRVELILATEWGGLRVFTFKDGSPKELTDQLGLSGETGLWQGIAVGDFDEDGRIDLVVANRGRNSAWRASRAVPLVADALVPGDGSGPVTLVSHGDSISGLPRLLNALPSLRERFLSAEAMARAKVQDLIPAGSSNRLLVRTLDTAIFFNRGGHFEMVALPPEAQEAPVFGPVAADFDGDGHLDLFLTQNVLEWLPEVSVEDSGRGLLLLGNGKGGFRPLNPDVSGLDLEGEQRGAAAGDFNGDGRPDIAVVSTEGIVRLHQNQSEPARTRISLDGGGLNSHAIGAVVRVFRGGVGGPAMPLTAGTGWLSCDAPVLMVPRLKAGDEVAALWPGGRSSRVVLAAALAELTLRPEEPPSR